MGFEINGLNHHRPVTGDAPDTSEPGHTSDLPLDVVGQDITLHVMVGHAGKEVNGRPVGHYQVAWRLGKRTPPDDRATPDEAEYMARALEFAAKRLRETYQ